jgi:parallel beta-helix repeat protein
MHNGRFKTSRGAVRYQGGGRGEGLDLRNLDDKIRVFSLSTEEQQDLVAFLRSLTDETRRPAVPDRVPSGLPVVPHLRGPAEREPRPAAAVAAPKTARPDGPRTLTVLAGGSIQSAVDRALPGDTIEVEPGTYRETVLVDVDRITLRGLVRGESRAILDGDGTRTDAVIASGHGFTIEGLALRNYTSNGITVQGATGVVFRDLVVESTGLYGVYPVECKDVLVERVIVTGAKDAGIYVGQSWDIVVRDSEAHDNVIGIEIENSVNALVENNYTHGNTEILDQAAQQPSKVGTDTRSSAIA